MKSCTLGRCWRGQRGERCCEAAGQKAVGRRRHWPRGCWSDDPRPALASAAIKAFCGSLQLQLEPCSSGSTHHTQAGCRPGQARPGQASGLAGTHRPWLSGPSCRDSASRLNPSRAVISWSNPRSRGTSASGHHRAAAASSCTHHRGHAVVGWPQPRPPHPMGMARQAAGHTRPSKSPAADGEHAAGELGLGPAGDPKGVGHALTAARTPRRVLGTRAA